VKGCDHVTHFFFNSHVKKVEFTEGMKKIHLKTGKMFSLKTSAISQENSGHSQESLAYCDRLSYGSCFISILLQGLDGTSHCTFNFRIAKNIQGITCINPSRSACRVSQKL
jgi:hypothetical protein